MDISEQEFQIAIQREEELRQNGYAVIAEYDARKNRLVVVLSSGVIIMVPVHLMQALAEADPAVLNEVEVAFSGLALPWPSRDADVYLPSLMQGMFGTRRWMAEQLWAESGLNNDGSAGSLLSEMAGMS